MKITNPKQIGIGGWMPSKKDIMTEVFKASNAAYSPVFWLCVSSCVESITKVIPELYQSDGYSRIQLTQQLDRLVDIIKEYNTEVIENINKDIKKIKD